MAGQHFARPVGFHAPAFFKDALGISQADKPWKVRLLFASEVATYIRERVWRASQELRQRRDGALEFRLQTSSRKALTRWILSWMPHIQVLAPRQLALGSTRVSMTAAEFKMKWSRYQGKESAAYQEHFIDLCRLLGQPTPVEADPSGNDFFCFQKRVVQGAEFLKAKKTRTSRLKHADVLIQ